MIVTVPSRPALQPNAVCAVRFLSAYDNYAAYPFAHFWQDGEGRYASLIDGAMVFVGDTVTDEWITFLSMQPTLCAVIADGKVGEKIATTLDRPFSSVDAMKLTTTTDGGYDPIPPKEAFTLLDEVFAGDLPPFDVWYADVSHRMRHAGCVIGGVMRDGRCVCSAMTTAETTGGALLGAVATHPDHRKQGLAGKTVAGLASALQQEGKQVFICPKHDAARRLYEKIGFTVCGRVITVK